MTSAARISVPQAPAEAPVPAPTREPVERNDERSRVVSRVISPKGARVRETVVILSEAAARRLMIQGQIPPR